MPRPVSGRSSGDRGPAAPRAALHLSRLFRMVRRAQPESLVSTSLLSGTLLGYLSGLQEVDPEGRDLPSGPGMSGRPHRNRGGPRERGPALPALGRPVARSRVSAIVPRSLDTSTKEKAFASPNRLPREGSGPDPHPPTANPSGPGTGGTAVRILSRKPKPGRLPTAPSPAYERDPRELVWAGETDDTWNLDERTGGALHLRVRESALLTVIRASRSIEGEGNPYEVIRRGEWPESWREDSRFPAISRRPPSRVRSRPFPAPCGRGGPWPRRDLVERIVAVARGEAACSGPRPGARGDSPRDRWRAVLSGTNG